MGKKKANEKKETAATGAEPRKAKASREIPVDLKELKTKAKDAQEGLEGARTEAQKLEEQGKALVDAAKEVYLKALEPYRVACRLAGVECEFEGQRAHNKTEMVRFLVEKAEKGIKVALKGKPDTEETIPFKALKESVSREAYAYTDRHIGPKAEIGNKGGGLANRLKAVLNG